MKAPTKRSSQEKEKEESSIEYLKIIAKEMTKMNSNINNMKDELKKEISDMKKEVKNEISDMKNEVKKEISSMKNELMGMKTEVAGLKELTRKQMDMNNINISLKQYQTAMVKKDKKKENEDLKKSESSAKPGPTANIFFEKLPNFSNQNQNSQSSQLNNSEK